MAFNRKDGYWKQAKREGKRSRAAYKLEEIDQRFRLFKKGQKILELGAAPGGWMEYIAGRIGPGGRILGLDLQKISGLPAPPCLTLVADILAPETGSRIDELLPPPLDGAVSDLAPNLTGIKATDQANSIAILEQALELVRPRLKNNGFFLCKVFQGGELKSFQQQLEKDFHRVTRAKPRASRKSSAEIYLVATGYAGRTRPQ
jgi:23S rRNA (uridine2552-2'-O)-methyltransferase